MAHLHRVFQRFLRVCIVFLRRVLPISASFRRVFASCFGDFCVTTWRIYIACFSDFCAFASCFVHRVLPISASFRRVFCVVFWWFLRNYTAHLHRVFQRFLRFCIVFFLHRVLSISASFKSRFSHRVSNQVSR